MLFFAPIEPGINIPVPLNDFRHNGIALIPSYGGAPLDIAVAIELIHARVLTEHEMIARRLSPAVTGLGFQLVTNVGESIIIEPHR